MLIDSSAFLSVEDHSVFRSFLLTACKSQAARYLLPVSVSLLLLHLLGPSILPHGKALVTKSAPRILLHQGSDSNLVSQRGYLLRRAQHFGSALRFECERGDIVDTNRYESNSIFRAWCYRYQAVNGPLQSMADLFRSFGTHWVAVFAPSGNQGFTRAQSFVLSRCHRPHHEMHPFRLVESIDYMNRDFLSSSRADGKQSFYSPKLNSNQIGHKFRCLIGWVCTVAYAETSEL